MFLQIPPQPHRVKQQMVVLGEYAEALVAELENAGEKVEGSTMMAVNTAKSANDRCVIDY